MGELWRLDAVAQASLVASGEVTAEELVEASLSRIEALNPWLNAVVGLDEDRVRSKAASPGPLAFVPTVLKDSLPAVGLRAAMGSRLLAGYRPTEAVPYTQRLEEAGLVALGKTTMSELGLLGSTETQLDGVTRNPWGPDLSAGGSSGGSAAAVAAGLVPVAHASDGGGSIRLPASLHGLFGFKPSAMATAPAYPVENEFVRITSEHCLSRSVRDSALWLALTMREPAAPVAPGPLSPLRIGVYFTDAYGREASAEGRAAVEASARLCADLGHHVEEVRPPVLSGEVISDGFFTIAGAAVAGIGQMMERMRGRPLVASDVEPYTWSLLRWHEDRGSQLHTATLASLEEQAVVLRAFLGEVDVALCPTLGGPRPRLGHLAPHLPLDTIRRRTERLAGFTAIHSVAGVTAMSVPLHWTGEGLPVGCHFAASSGQDTSLLRLAFQLEQAAPWRDRWPAMVGATGA
ncbi:MAG: amidase [Myxococcales bacterium]|nr:amidase [Myxococcales bacterium]